MKFALIKDRLQSGSRLMVTMPVGNMQTKRALNLSCGPVVSEDQFSKLRDNLTPSDPPLIPGAEPQSYIWKQ